MIRVWFNHWFRTAYSLIELVRQTEDEDIYIIGSNLTAESPIKLMCDEWYVEENLREDEYVGFCLDFCKKHNIDVLVPYRNMAVIAAEKDKFEAIGVKLMCESSCLMDLLEDKAAAYEHLSVSGINIPEYRIISTASELECAYKDLSARYDRLCIKCTNDRGGQSFRVISEHIDKYESLFKYPSSAVSYDSLRRILSEKASFKSMMIMPLMSQPEVEVSADCLDCGSERIIIPRFKYSGHVEKIIYDNEIISMVNKVMDIIAPKYIIDVQFRYLNGVPHLLEVNARMSGGLPLSCAAAGVNIPALSLKKVLGREMTAPKYIKETKTISFVEVPTAPH